MRTIDFLFRDFRHSGCLLKQDFIGYTSVDAAIPKSDAKFPKLSSKMFINAQSVFRFITICSVATLLSVWPTAGSFAQAVAEPEIKQADRPGDAAAEGERPLDAADAKIEKSSHRKEKASGKKRQSETEHFMRIRKNAKGRPIAMETSITRYELINEKGQRITVDLIGVVHIGEEKYFETLNERFEEYEGLLYELVAPEGTVIPKGGRSEVGLNPIAAMQKGMQAVLGLEFQLDHVDYTKENFVHADMTPTEFAESMKNNEESISKITLRAIGQSMALQNAGKGGNNMSMLMAMFSKNKEIKMRRMFAEQMQNMEAGMIMFEGKEGSTIIDHRNAKCMEVLEREIQDGKKNLAIFYGAGHLPDMQRRLMSKFKMKRGGQNWLQAWSLEIPEKGSKEDKSKK
jgi:hypothetical protein